MENGQIEVGATEYGISCTICHARDILLRDMLITAVHEWKEQGWRRVEGKWYCPKCEKLIP